MKPIAFGTDGWRAVIARDFTFSRVWAAATGYAEWLLAQKETRPVLVSFDARFLSEKFAAVTATALAEKGISLSISDRPAITPAASYHVAANGLGGAAIITASHNPPEWNGFKIKTADGASAPTETTDAVRDYANALLKAGDVPEEYNIWAPSQAATVNLQTAYVERLGQLADLELIRGAGLRIVVDNMHAAGTGYLDILLEKAGCQVEVVRADRDPLFGGVNPEPIEDNLGASLALTRNKEVDVGFALDGDGDRLGLMASGEFISTHRMMALLALHLLRNRKEKGALVRTVNMTSMIDALAEHFGVPLLETPVGFKNVAKLMLSREVTIGGEESGGTGFAGHIPERDACLAALRICEFMATEGKSVPELLELLWEYVGGPHYFERLDIRFSQEQKEEALERLAQASPKQLAGKSVVDENSLDGRKFFLEDNAWLLIRPSGTEPLIRIYAEAKSEEAVGHILKAGEDLVMGK